MEAAPKAARPRGTGDGAGRTVAEPAFRKVVPGTLRKIRRCPQCFFGGRCRPMAPVDDYQVKALEFRAMARSENDPNMRAEFKNLERAYRRLAEQAERNSQLDLTYETPPIKKN